MVKVLQNIYHPESIQLSDGQYNENAVMWELLTNENGLVKTQSFLQSVEASSYISRKSKREREKDRALSQLRHKCKCRHALTAAAKSEQRQQQRGCK